MFPFFLLAIVYYIVGFASNFKNFLNFIFIGVFEALVGMMIGLFLGTAASDIHSATEIAPMIFIPFMLFCGFLTNVDNILPPLKFFEYLSPIRYTFEYLIKNEFEEYHELLGEIHPLKTLNFDFSYTIIIIALSCMFFGYLVLVVLLLKFTTKQIMN